jgi:hypothetical protein
MPDSKVTFQLASDLDAKTFGGSLALRDGSAYDVAAELKAGGGKIVTEDEHLITALDAYHGTERATSSPAPAPKKGEDS